MKKEVSAFALVLAAVLLFVYLFNLSPTGFVVYQQSDLSGGTYSNTLFNGSAVMLNSSVNATSGSYTSAVLDAGNNSVWNNMTWTGAVPVNSSLSFQVTTCSDANCSGVNFADVTSTNNTIDLSGMNLTSQYFQYKVLFSRNDTNATSPSLTGVSYAYSAVAVQNATNETQNQTNSTNQTAVSVSITDPTGSLDYQTDISVDYKITGGTNLTCWYMVTSGGSTTIAKTMLSGCGSSNFNVDNDGSYVFNLYVNGSSGLIHKTSDFTVDTSSQQTQQQQNTTQQQQQNTTQQQTQTPVVPPTVTKLSASSIASPNIVQGDSKNMTFTVKNSGTTSLSGCALKLTGKQSSWFKILDKSKSISPGKSVGFAFIASVPLNTAVGSYADTAKVSCAQTSASANFKINVQQKKLNVSILSVQRNKLDNVKVSYSLSDLTGKNQNVSAAFKIIDANKAEVGNASDTNELAANATKDFSLNIPINSSAEGNMSLSGTFGSEKFSTTILEPILLGAPVSGFAIGPLGTGGSLAVVLGVIVVFVVLFFGVKRLRKKAKKKSEHHSESSHESEH